MKVHHLPKSQILVLPSYFPALFGFPMQNASGKREHFTTYHYLPCSEIILKLSIKICVEFLLKILSRKLYINLTFVLFSSPHFLRSSPITNKIHTKICTGMFANFFQTYPFPVQYNQPSSYCGVARQR